MASIVDPDLDGFPKGTDPDLAAKGVQTVGFPWFWGKA
jgi:hypothetical protein